MAKATSWLTLFIVLVVRYDVIVRYLFDSSSVALQELKWHIFAIIFLLAAMLLIIIFPEIALWLPKLLSSF
ncbi:MAG: hypothetical protein V3V72_13365 [Ignavibacteriaceae bacterium]